MKWTNTYTVGSRQRNLAMIARMSVFGCVKSTVIMATIIESKRSEYCHLFSCIELTLIEVLV